MAKTIRSKFAVLETETQENGDRKVTLTAVVCGSEENKEFWKYTPAGKIEIQISNPEVVFEPGEYYVDFTKA